MLALEPLLQVLLLLLLLDARLGLLGVGHVAETLTMIGPVRPPAEDKAVRLPHAVGRRGEEPREGEREVAGAERLRLVEAEPRRPQRTASFARHVVIRSFCTLCRWSASCRRIAYAPAV